VFITAGFGLFCDFVHSAIVAHSAGAEAYFVGVAGWKVCVDVVQSDVDGRRGG